MGSHDPGSPGEARLLLVQRPLPRPPPNAPQPVVPSSPELLAAVFCLFSPYMVTSSTFRAGRRGREGREGIHNRPRRRDRVCLFCGRGGRGISFGSAVCVRGPAPKKSHPDPIGAVWLENEGSGGPVGLLAGHRCPARICWCSAVAASRALQ